MTGLPSKETTAEDFLSKFDESLKRLKMDYVDILYVHQVLSPEMVGFKPIIKAMKKLRDKGKIRFLGISTHNLPRIIDSIVKTGSWDVVLTTYNYLNTELIRDRAEPPVKGMDIALQKAADAGLGVVAMKTLAGVDSSTEKNKANKCFSSHKVGIVKSECSYYHSGNDKFRSALY